MRTPLAVMQISLEIILENEDETVKSQKEWLENIIVEYRRMVNLVDNAIKYLGRPGMITVEVYRQYGL